ncbi:hypothetical protein ACPDHL_11985 [Myroides sp. C15-4]|uniref:hypothetical protein n=1 Tax=Myroides sp. C15-4 TaxID=3400532 RepID=UPI003D2F6E06
MKNSLLKNVGALALIGFFILLAFGSGDSNSGDSYSPSTNYDNYNGSSYSGSSNSSSSYLSKTCGWCGKTFRGNHYTHFGNISSCEKVSDDKPSIGKYCSMKCCSEARNGRN